MEYVFYRVAVIQAEVCNHGPELHKQKVVVQLPYKQSGLLFRTLPYTLSKWNVTTGVHIGTSECVIVSGGAHHMCQNGSVYGTLVCAYRD